MCIRDRQDAGTMIQKFVPRLPTVLLGTPALVSGDEVNSVCIDNLAGGRLAAEHLLELGHRDIVYLGHRPNSLTHQLRLRGFTEMLEDVYKRQAQHAVYCQTGSGNLCLAVNKVDRCV